MRVFCIILFFSFCSFAEKVEEYVVEIVLKDHHFVPEVIEVPANKMIILIIYNSDEKIAEFESFDLKREKIIPAKGKIKVKLKPMKPGEYEFFEEFHHPNPKGKIIVR